jgi:hypothetical protein
MAAMGLAELYGFEREYASDRPCEGRGHLRVDTVERRPCA